MQGLEQTYRTVQLTGVREKAAKPYVCFKKELKVVGSCVLQHCINTVIVHESFHTRMSYSHSTDFCKEKKTSHFGSMFSCCFFPMTMSMSAIKVQHCTNQFQSLRQQCGNIKSNI